MPSRRIGSYVNLCPQQELSINPFDTFNSDTVNKLTKMVSNGRDGVINGLHVKTERYYIDTINNFEIFKSGDILTTDFEYDVEKCEPIYLAGSDERIEGFRITDITKLQIITFTYKFKNDSFLKYAGTKTKCRFNFQLNLTSGSPYRIIGSIGEDSYSIKYPRYNDSNIKLSVLHNLKTDSKTEPIQLKLSFILNPEDYNSGTYGEYIDKTKYYNGQSEIEFNNIKFDCELLSLEDKIENYTQIDNFNGLNYPISQIHPSKQIYVTQGIVIKDNMLIHEKGLDKNQNTPTMILDVGDRRCWIKSNPFTKEEFYLDGAKQTAYCLNKTDVVALEGSVNIEKSTLQFQYGGLEDIESVDDLQLSKYSQDIDFTVDSSFNDYILITVNAKNIDTNYHKLYGNIAYFVDKTTNKIIQRVNLKCTTYENYTHYDTQTITLEKKNYHLDNFKLVVDIGPIKVSGNIDEYNTEMTKWANVVIYYTYFKHPEPNKNYIGLIRDEDLNDEKYREDYLVLGKVRFISPTEIDIISYENRQQISYKSNLARNIDYINQIPVEHQLYWLNPLSKTKELPTNTSDAITKLAKWINDVTDSSSEKLQSDWNITDDTSPQYIRNKPNIPDAQIQSDWNQTDTTKLDFIKNKPDVIQSDWNQTDTTKLDFIKNKPYIPPSFDKIQSDWNQTDNKQTDYIKNKPTILSKDDIEALIKQYTRTEIGTLKFIAKPTLAKIDENSDDFDGWVYPDGRSLSRKDFKEAFSVFGTTYGKDDDNTFKIPKLEDFIKLNPGVMSYETSKQTYNNPLPQHDHTATIKTKSSTITLENTVYGTNTRAFDGVEGTIAECNEVSTAFVSGCHAGTVYAKYANKNKDKIILSRTQLKANEWGNQYAKIYLDADYNGIPLFTTDTTSKVDPARGYNNIDSDDILKNIEKIEISKTDQPEDLEPRPYHNIIPVLIYIGKKEKEYVKITYDDNMDTKHYVDITYNDNNN